MWCFVTAHGDVWHDLRRRRGCAASCPMRRAPRYDSLLGSVDSRATPARVRSSAGKFGRIDVDLGWQGLIRCSMPSSARPRITADAKYGLADGSMDFTSTLAPCGFARSPCEEADRGLAILGSPADVRPGPHARAASADPDRIDPLSTPWASGRPARNPGDRVLAVVGHPRVGPIPLENTGVPGTSTAKSVGVHLSPPHRRTAQVTN